MRKWIPFLPSEEPAKNRFDVTFISELKQELTMFCHDATNGLQGLMRVGHVVKSADHGGAVKKTADKRKFVDVRGDVDKVVAVPQAFPGLHELRTRVVQQYDAIPVWVALCQPAGASAQFEQKMTALVEEFVNRDGFDGVFITTVSAVPKAGLII